MIPVFWDVMLSLEKWFPAFRRTFHLQLQGLTHSALQHHNQNTRILNPQSPHCENFKTGTQFSVIDFIFSFIFFPFTDTAKVQVTLVSASVYIMPNLDQTVCSLQPPVVMTTQKLNF